MAVAACLIATAAAVFAYTQDAAGPDRSATPPTLRQAILTAFHSAAGMVLESRATVFERGGVAVHSLSWLGPTLPQPGTTARYRYMAISPGGRPLQQLAETYTASRRDFTGPAQGFVGSGGVTRRITTVDYTRRTWTSSETRQDAVISLADDPSLLRHEVAIGLWRMAGRVTIHGRPALKLEWKAAAGTTERTGRLRRTLWVDAHSYLPIRQRIQLGSGPSGEFYGITATYRLLASTPANLAHLRPVIPSRFRRTHGPGGATPVTVSPFL